MKKIIRFLCIVFAASFLLGTFLPAGRSYAFTEEEQAHMGQAREALQALLGEQPVMALVYLAEQYTCLLYTDPSPRD